MRATVSGLVVEGIIAGARSMGLCDDGLYELVGWSEGPPEGVALWQHRVAMTSWGRLWEALAEQDEAVAVRLGAQVRIGGMGLLGYAMASCETLLDALKQMRWAKRVLSDDAVVIEREHPWGTAIGYELAEPAMPGGRLVLEHACVSLVGMCRWLCGDDVSPEVVWTTYPPPSYARRLEESVGAPVVYRQSHNACFYTDDALQRRLVGANPHLHSRFADELGQQLALLREGLSWATRVQLCLEDAWPATTPPTLAVIAEQLGCSPRTLQRQLRLEGPSFRELVQRAQQDAAVRLLGAVASEEAARPLYSIEEIASRVGFSEASTFSRAFRRWTGQAPGAFRRESLASSESPH